MKSLKSSPQCLTGSMLVTLSVVAIFAASCATDQVSDADAPRPSSRNISAQYPPDTLVITNATSCILKLVSWNDTPWQTELHDRYGKPLIVPIDVSFHSKRAINGRSTMPHEVVAIRIDAMKMFGTCGIREVCVGSYTNLVTLGTDEPAKMIRIGNEDLCRMP